MHLLWVSLQFVADTTFLVTLLFKIAEKLLLTNGRNIMIWNHITDKHNKPLSECDHPDCT